MSRCLDSQLSRQAPGWPADGSVRPSSGGSEAGDRWSREARPTKALQEAWGGHPGIGSLGIQVRRLTPQQGIAVEATFWGERQTMILRSQLGRNPGSQGCPGSCFCAFAVEMPDTPS